MTVLGMWAVMKEPACPSLGGSEDSHGRNGLGMGLEVRYWWPRKGCGPVSQEDGWSRRGWRGRGSAKHEGGEVQGDRRSRPHTGGGAWFRGAQRPCRASGQGVTKSSLPLSILPSKTKHSLRLQ